MYYVYMCMLSSVCIYFKQKRKRFSTCVNQNVFLSYKFNQIKTLYSTLGCELAADAIVPFLPLSCFFLSYLLPLVLPFLPLDFLDDFFDFFDERRLRLFRF